MTEQHYSEADLQEQDPIDAWRNEVQARLQHYKSRRGRRVEGAFSMRFPFPPEEYSAPVEIAPRAEVQAPLDSAEVVAIATTVPKQEEPMATEAPAVQQDTNLTQPEARIDDQKSAFALAREPEPEPAYITARQPRPRPRKKIIAFPGPVYTNPYARQSLADPILPEQMRILDVPEELEAVAATPFLEGFLDARPGIAPEPVRPDSPELPSRAASAGSRLWAGTVDFVVIGLGAVVFSAAGYQFLPSISLTKSTIACAVAVATMLWALYEFLFLVWAGQTPGMKTARIRLLNFKGDSPTRRQRKLRVVGLYLSVLSLGMGILWHFVDVDSLCWQDRISQTFPAIGE